MLTQISDTMYTIYIVILHDNKNCYLYPGIWKKKEKQEIKIHTFLKVINYKIKLLFFFFESNTLIVFY